MDVFDWRCSLRFSGEVSWDNLIHMLNSRYLQSSTQWLFLIVQYVFNLTVKILPYMQGPFPRLWSFLIFWLQSPCADMYLCISDLNILYPARWYDISGTYGLLAPDPASAVPSSWLASRLCATSLNWPGAVLMSIRRWVCATCSRQGSVQKTNQNQTFFVAKYPWGEIHLWYVSMHGNCIWKGTTFRIHNNYKIFRKLMKKYWSLMHIPGSTADPWSRNAS